jgi:hypothetical protein
MKPEMIVPIHNCHAENFKNDFPNIGLVDDREIVEI